MIEAAYSEKIEAVGKTVHCQYYHALVIEAELIVCSGSASK
jgi:hypothetical protein